MTQIVEGLAITQTGKRDWIVRRAEDDGYLGVITSFGGMNGEAHYMASADRHGAPLHPTLHDAITVFTGLAA